MAIEEIFDTLDFFVHQLFITSVNSLLLYGLGRLNGSIIDLNDARLTRRLYKGVGGYINTRYYFYMELQ